ncbi:hypothetical protein Ccrd_026327 [Cynara cardunculus var. scolymus]|uniref:Uncharacterized protein n=1 Tax=Cynara cardunculus var. scolymus TaxID=59895 RepID=A0A118JSF7_CYNCS|nr:hypothetical protein Ccrd_026327 [Cynara cardunculus var. scolymus]
MLPFQLRLMLVQKNVRGQKAAELLALEITKELENTTSFQHNKHDLVGRIGGVVELLELTRTSYTCLVCNKTFVSSFSSFDIQILGSNFTCLGMKLYTQVGEPISM